MFFFENPIPAPGAPFVFLNACGTFIAPFYFLIFISLGIIGVGVPSCACSFFSPMFFPCGIPFFFQLGR